LRGKLCKSSELSCTRLPCAKGVRLYKVRCNIVIGCVLAAGCTSNTTQQQSASDVSSNNGTQDSAYQPARVYDLEHHYYHPEFIDYLKTRVKYPYLDGINIRFNDVSNFPIASPSFNSDSTVKEEITNLGNLRLSIMDDAGITTGVISSGVGMEMTSISKEDAVKYARLTNDAVAEAVKKYPGRFLGAITLPTPYVEESIAELERCVNELGLQYWHTHSNYGAAADVMRTSYLLIVNGTFDRYPNLTLILGHLGEYYPYSLTRMDNRILPNDSYIKCKENLSYYFKNKNILITTSGITVPNTIECAINAIGIDSIMFATDYPYENVKGEVDAIKYLPISDEDKDKIFYKNAEKYVLKDRTPKSA